MSETLGTTKKRERGLCELYEEDPERADALIFDRRWSLSRRGFLTKSSLAAMSGVLGAPLVHHALFPTGLIPAAWAEDNESQFFQAKDGLLLLNDRPLNAETPAHLLDDPITPASRLFVRNNGLLPNKDLLARPEDWTLTINGFVDTPLKLFIEDLKANYKVVTKAFQLECAGNGRAAFNPPAPGNQWSVGAVGCPMWTGVRLRDVLKTAGVKPEAIYTAHYGADQHLSGDEDKLSISRGVPLWKAMHPDTLLAFAMNGEDIPLFHGYPLRLVVPGWPGSVSHKWLTRIELRDVVHDGPKMTGTSYRVPDYPVEPGADVPEADYQIIESMPVKSLITSPQNGFILPRETRTLEVRGYAWAGENRVRQVMLSTDFGATWTRTRLQKPKNRYAWQNWKELITFPEKGYYEIWAMAIDNEGRRQPFAVNWNPKGYINNAMHRISVKVLA